MNVATGMRGGIGLVLCAVALVPGFGAVADDAAAPAPSALKWSPYRAAATAPERPDAADAPPAPLAAPPAPLAAVVAPPARLAPAPAAREARSSAPQAVRRPPTVAAPAPWPSPNRTPGVSPGTVAARDPRAARTAPSEPTFFGMSLFRAPQGDAPRPVYAGEGLDERDGVRPVLAAGPDGLRFTPRQVGAGGDRIPRGPDGRPSVVSRVPGSSMPTASMPRQRLAARSVSDQPTPAGELPPPADAAPARSSAGRPTPAEGYPVLEEPRGAAPGAADDGLSFGPDGDVGFGDGPLDMGDGYPMPGEGELMFPDGGMPDDGGAMMMDEGPWYGGVQMHIPSFYDDPYACEDGEYCPGCYPWWDHDGRVLAFFRRLGRPYYGWRWYRDFTASVGVTSFQNTSDLGLHGNYGVNEYLNWSMPFWNAFGVGWQVGVRGVQADFQQTKVLAANGTPIFSAQSRNQVFLTTGFFTRAFEGRGLQGGAVYDYLQDNWYGTAESSQVRGEVSYVWGYNEFGFWGAFNTYNENGIFAPGKRGNRAYIDTLDLYTGFYRLQFGDANELKIWGGASGQGDNLLGALIRAPMTRSVALEGTFTYLIPRTGNTVTLPTGEKVNFSEQAWNLSANVVWYPACRARRSLASPYRPLFDVADNGSMITAISVPRQ
ncbi:MAG: DUF6666 family protein [Planctomycetaceae bacterium]